MLTEIETIKSDLNSQLTVSVGIVFIFLKRTVLSL